MRIPLIAGNWKMHKTLAQARVLVKEIAEGLPAGARGPEHMLDVLICPPFPLLFPMAKAIDGTPIQLGAQDAHFEKEGAYTGEVSVPMISGTGCRFVIIGHSERRQHFGESGKILAKKVRAVTDGELNVIFCVGETLEDRDAGRTEAVIQQQFAEAITSDLPARRVVVAYEPVWAIGTGRTASPEQAQEVHALIRGLLARTFDDEAAGEISILYGGSVKPGNAADLLSCPDIDGALVGGASLVAQDFLAIINAAEAVTSRTA